MRSTFTDILFEARALAGAGNGMIQGLRASSQACGIHGHDHAGSWSHPLPTSDPKSFWGALGCACWAV